MSNLWIFRNTHNYWYAQIQGTDIEYQFKNYDAVVNLAREMSTGTVESIATSIDNDLIFQYLNNNTGEQIVKQLYWNSTDLTYTGVADTAPTAVFEAETNLEYEITSAGEALVEVMGLLAAPKSAPAVAKGGLKGPAPPVIIQPPVPQLKRSKAQNNETHVNGVDQKQSNVGAPQTTTPDFSIKVLNQTMDPKLSFTLRDSSNWPTGIIYENIQTPTKGRSLTEGNADNLAWAQSGSSVELYETSCALVYDCDQEADYYSMFAIQIHVPAQVAGFGSSPTYLVDYYAQGFGVSDWVKVGGDGSQSYVIPDGPNQMPYKVNIQPTHSDSTLYLVVQVSDKGT